MKSNIFICIFILFNLSCSETSIITKKMAPVNSKEIKVTKKIVPENNITQNNYSKYFSISGKLSTDGTMRKVYGLRFLDTPLITDNKNSRNDPNGYFKFEILSKDKKIIHSFKKSYKFNKGVCIGHHCTSGMKFSEQPFAVNIISADDEFYLKVFVNEEQRFSSGLIKIKKCQTSFMKCIQSMGRRKVK